MKACAALTSIAMFALVSSVASADDMSTLRDNIVVQLTTARPAATTDSVALLRPDGSFADLDYTPNPITYVAFKHVGRLHDMAVEWGRHARAGDLDPARKSALLSAYNYWIAHDIQHRNWWFNEIGVPDSLSDTMLILQKYDALPRDNFRKAIGILDRALPRQTKLSAANLVWTAYATRNEGVLDYFDPAAVPAAKAAATALVLQSFQRINSTITFTASDGINVDYCFHAHGPVPFNGGYGVAWLDDTSRIAASAAGTPYGLTEDKVKLIIDYVLGGDQFMSRGVNYDLITIGREWSRSHVATAGGLHAAVGYLSTLGLDYRATELARLQGRLDRAFAQNSAEPSDTAVGNRAYYTADYMVQQRGGYFFSVKTVSKRTNLPESINSENFKGGYGYSGVNFLYRTGNEYDEIEPVWDWYRLPGTTSERAAGGIGGSYSIKPPANKRGPKTIAGGASDGSVGAHAYQFSQYNVSANKSWFLFDRGEVALGNSITQTKPETAGDVVGTNVNQTLLHGPVVYGAGTTGPATLGEGRPVTPKQLRWVNHDSVGYFFLQPVDTATIRAESRTASWHDINLAQSADPITKKVFDLDLDHGPLPANAAYAYAVVPGLAAGEMESFAAAPPFTVLRNDAVAQAVTDSAHAVTGANFFTAGDVSLAPGVNLTSSAPQSASVILARHGHTLTISVASPEHRAGSLSLQLTGHYTGDDAVWDTAAARTTFTFTLPGGPTAGSTVTQTFTAVP